MSSTNIPSQNHVEYLNNSKVLLAAVISLSAVVTLVLLLHAYARWFLHRRAAIIVDATGDPLHRRSLTALVSYASDTQPLDNGLDRKVITKLPLFTVEQDGAGLECVVCLSVMEAGENGRILPGCKHHFHVKCIDTWLMCHSTCPVCRTIVKAEKPLASGMPVSVSLAVEDTAAQEIVVISPAVTQTETSVEVSTTLPITSSSLGCSHKRMLSKSRSEGRVFPSVVNWSRSLSP